MPEKQDIFVFNNPNILRKNTYLVIFIVKQNKPGPTK